MKRLSKAAIEEKYFQVEKYLMEKLGVDEAKRKMYPLDWYWSRSNSYFLNWLINEKAYIIGRILLKGGSTDEVIGRMKRKAEARNYSKRNQGGKRI